MELERVSQLSGVKHIREIDVTQKELDAWQASGQHIQNYFPQLSADDREFILTGVTPEEWDFYMGDDDEEDLLPEEFDAFFASGEPVEIILEQDTHE